MPFRTEILSYIVLAILLLSCKKQVVITPATEKKLPKADFTITLKNAGSLPANVEFTSTSLNASELAWSFDDGETDLRNEYSLGVQAIPNVAIYLNLSAFSIMTELFVLLITGSK